MRYNIFQRVMKRWYGESGAVNHIATRVDERRFRWVRLDDPSMNATHDYVRMNGTAPPRGAP